MQLNRVILKAKNNRARGQIIDPLTLVSRTFTVQFATVDEVYDVLYKAINDYIAKKDPEKDLKENTEIISSVHI